jgi:starch synthase (maltosyl-transferring)
MQPAMQEQKPFSRAFLLASGTAALCRLVPRQGAWAAGLARARELGFDAVVLDPDAGPDANADFGGAAAPADDLAALVASAASEGLGIILDLSPQRASGPLAAEEIAAWCEAGIAGFRCTTAHHLPPGTWARTIAAARARHPGTLFLAFAHGATPEALGLLAPCGFDAAASSSCWWDFRAGWIDEDAARLAAFGPVIAMPEPPGSPPDSPIGSPPIADPRARRRALLLAAHYAPIWMMRIGFEAADLAPDLALETARLNASRHAHPALFAGPPARLVSPPGAEIAVLARGTRQNPGLVLALNPDLDRPAALPASSVLPAIGGAGGVLVPEDAMDSAPGSAIGSAPGGEHEPIGPAQSLRLGPGEGLVLRFVPTSAIRRASRRAVERVAAAPRIAIEAVRPAIEDGRFPARRIVGDTVTVAADLIADGHERLAADLLWRAADEIGWERTPMKPLGNDRFAAQFPLARIGRYLFTIEAWHDRFASLLDEIAKKRAAAIGIALELEEAIDLVRAAAHNAAQNATVNQQAGAAPLAPLAALLAKLEQAGPEARLALLSAPETAALMRAGAPRPFLVRREPPLPLESERPAAGFASWYELFPRSQSGDPARHGTFADVITRLPAIRAMGFDILYFPPIHPIGRVNRKGPNNALAAGPDDPGSPYAIGAAEGGHDAIHPALGTRADFQRLRVAAAAEGIEIALDFAIQCAPDHPWVSAHPEWFEWRPDGSIRYAENPPKRYEDIVNVAFHAPGAVPALWNALRDVVRFWLAEGVRIFRVDNPHTKPLPFWEWLIEDIRVREPDVIFLAEAFTRPTMMYRLAKIGFSQSYTYFTWRNTKHELTAYFTELATPPLADFFRPNLFVNTPDINPFFLQQGGRPAFLIRAVLAATLSGLWGVYNGFELCESRALPGREEYLDSEKYQIRAWDWDRPGNITAEITRLNAIRRANPALHSHRGLEFLNAFDDDILYYAKTSPDLANTLLVAVNLDPHRAIEAEIEIPLWRFGLPDHASIGAEDLMRGGGLAWHGKRQRIRLDPADLPFAIWRLDRPQTMPLENAPLETMR